MNYLQFKEIYDFSINPNTSNLRKFHEFLNNASPSLLKNNSLLFFNCLLIEIRKNSKISKHCVEELLVLLEILPELDDVKILLIVLEEITNFIQNFVHKNSNKDNVEEFECLDMQFAFNVIKIFSVILRKSIGNRNEHTIFSSSGLLLLSYIVSLSLHFVQYYKERNLQSEALSVLLFITSCQSSFIIDKANVVVHLAPGILKVLTKVIQTDRKVGSIIKSEALKCFGNLVILIYGNKSYSNDQKKLSTKGETDLSNIIIERNDKWIKDTWKNVGFMIKIIKRSIIERAEEEHWKVRLELIKVCVSILEECQCVGSTAVDLVDYLIVMSADTDTMVCDEASRAVERVTKITLTIPIYWDGDENNSSQMAQSGNLLLVTVIRDNIDSVIDTLRKLPSTFTDDGKCNTLHMLDGYLKLYGSHKLGKLSIIHLQQIMTHLVTFCQLDYSTIDLFEIAHSFDTQTSNNFTTNGEFIIKPFVHFHNDRVYNLIKSIVSRIITIVNMSTLWSMLNSLSVEDPNNICQIMLIIRLVVSSLSDTDSISKTEKISACKTVLGTYFNYDITSLITSNDTVNEKPSSFWTQSVMAIEAKNRQIHTISVCTENSSPNVLKKNALTLALLMELCAACAMCISTCGSDDEVESWLMRTCLFEVMSKGQQSPRILSYAASQTLHILSLVHPKYERSISSLVRINGDYIMDAAARRLRNAAIALKIGTSDPGVLTKLESSCRCLVTLCQHADIDVLPFMSVILDQMLFCLDSSQGIGQCSFMEVLSEMVRAIVRWTGTSLSPILAISDRAEKSDHFSNGDIVRAFMCQRNDILVSSGLRKEQVNDTDDQIEETQNNKEPNATCVIICKIVDRCIHLSSSSTSTRMRITCLRILNEAICALQVDQDLLAQTVHQLWSPLEHRLWDKQFPVIIRAFDLLNTISQLCGGFLLLKIRTGVVSKLCSVLENSARISVCPSDSNKYTGLYRLQSTMLRFLARLCIRTGLDGALMEEVVDALLLYLDDRQPMQLTEACCESLKQLLRYNPGLVWFKIAQIDPKVTDRCHIYGHRARIYDDHFVVNARQLLSSL